MAFNKYNGVNMNMPAKELAYLHVEGVNVCATDAEWKRIRKRLNTMGLVTYGTIMLNDNTEVSSFIESCDLTAEVDLFIEEMWIMGLLDQPDDDDDDDNE
jgi:hypothetical protein